MSIYCTNMHLHLYVFLLLSFQNVIHSFRISNYLSKRGSFHLLAVDGQQIEKEKLLKAFDDDSSSNDILACPQSLTSLTKKTRVFGKLVENFFVSSKFDSKYKIFPSYYDLTIKSEVDRPLWDLSSSERVGQKFFQIPLISFIYERGAKYERTEIIFPLFYNFTA